MKTAQTDLQEHKLRQEKKKQEETQHQQQSKQTQSLSASALAQLLTSGYAQRLPAGLMSREMAARLGNTAMTALMGEDGYQPERLPANEDVLTDPFDADGEAVSPETLP